MCLQAILSRGLGFLVKVVLHGFMEFLVNLEVPLYPPMALSRKSNLVSLSQAEATCVLATTGST